MEVIAIAIAALSCALVGVNTIFSSEHKSSVRRGRTPQITPKEELGKAATRYLEYLEKTQSLSLPEAKQDMSLVLTEYLSKHEQEVAARDRERRRAS